MMVLSLRVIMIGSTNPNASKLFFNFSYSVFGIILFCFKEALFSFVFIGIGFIGMLVSLMLRVLSLYVKKASILKEEADATL